MRALFILLLTLPFCLYPQSPVLDSLALEFKNLHTKGNDKSALETFELYIQKRDSINNIEFQKASLRQQNKYEFDKQKAVDDKTHELEIKQAEEKAVTEKNKQNMIIVSVSVVLMLVALFSIFLYNRFKVAKKQKAIIERQKKEVEDQKNLVDEKQKEILDSIRYAKRIQTALITSEKFIQKKISELR